MSKSTEKRDPANSGRIHPKKPVEFLNYFGKDRKLHQWLAERRTRLIGAVFPRFVQVGLVPDTISYLGIVLLTGFIFYFARNPLLSACFLAGNVICDGLDGAFARNSGKASQSGAFTDLVCDQVGMVVVAFMAVLHHLVGPFIGGIYVALYLIVVVFGVIINVLGLRTRITITSKYFLYIVFLVWAVWEKNFFPEMMGFFSVVMAIEVVVGYLRLKRGIRKKFDTTVRFAEGDPYSGRLNYLLNVSVPLVVLIAILVGANLTPIRAVFDRPKQDVQWKVGPDLLPKKEFRKILGIAVVDQGLVALIRDVNGALKVKAVPRKNSQRPEDFVVPGYVEPAFGTLPTDGNVLLLVDRTTHMLMGFDLEASFVTGRAVIVLTLPMGHLNVTALAPTQWRNKKSWLVANYLSTLKTYVVDQEKALKSGSITGGLVAWYENAAFPSGLVTRNGRVIEFNRSSWNAVIYSASMAKLIAGQSLLDAADFSFPPPTPDAIGPVIYNDALFMVSPNGRTFQASLKSLPR